MTASRRHNSSKMTSQQSSNAKSKSIFDGNKSKSTVAYTPVASSSSSSFETTAAHSTTPSHNGINNNRRTRRQSSSSSVTKSKWKRNLVIGSTVILLLIISIWFLLIQTRLLSSSSSSSESKSSSPSDSKFHSNSIAHQRPLIARPAPIVVISVINKYSHDSSAFTQGLEFDSDSTRENEMLYESTGMYNASQLRKVDYVTGRTLEATSLDARLFGEGLTIVESTIYQLTWREHVCLKYDKSSMKQISQFRVRHDGWGITHDRENAFLIISDGSSRLFYYDLNKPHKLLYNVTVKGWNDQLQSIIDVDRLNELESINGFIYANIWFLKQIAVIKVQFTHDARRARNRPISATVVQWLDASALDSGRSDMPMDAVLNGIAYSQKRRTILVTGKMWHSTYECELPQPPTLSFNDDDHNDNQDTNEPD